MNDYPHGIASDWSGATVAVGYSHGRVLLYNGSDPVRAIDTGIDGAIDRLAAVESPEESIAIADFYSDVQLRRFDGSLVWRQPSVRQCQRIGFRKGMVYAESESAQVHLLDITSGREEQLWRNLHSLRFDVWGDRYIARTGVHGGPGQLVVARPHGAPEWIGEPTAFAIGRATATRTYAVLAEVPVALRVIHLPSRSERQLELRPGYSILAMAPIEREEKVALWQNRSNEAGVLEIVDLETFSVTRIAEGEPCLAAPIHEGRHWIIAETTGLRSVSVA